MKKVVINIVLFFTLITGVFFTPVICHAEENEKMIPVYGRDVKDGTYTIEVDSSSSMFRVVDAKLEVTDGNMTSVITLSGTGYLKLFMGTGEEALKSGEEAYIPYVENEEGAYTYTIPVEVLNQEFACAAFSKRKEKWYDRQLVFLASSLPEEAVFIDLEEQTEESETEETETEAAPAKIENPDLTPLEMQVKDGEYTMEVTLKGGSGRATVMSPARISVTEKETTAFLEWSSPSFDYMIVNGKQYFPVNEEGNSVFEIPVLALDQEMNVIADTVAMSKAHEIEYQITFHSDTLKNTKNINAMVIIISVIAVGMVIAALVVCFKRIKKKNG